LSEQPTPREIPYARTAPQAAEPAALARGTLLGGRFEVRDRLGVGGAGVVYAAHDRLLGEDVALKVLHESLRRDEDELRRLRSEVLAARRIAHPNVCRVHDLCTDGDRVFVVMELLRGETLRRRMRRRLELGSVLDVVRQLGAGLAAAHRAGIVHCDVKPENAIWIGERVVLTDFGIARPLRVERERALGARVAGRVEGTPAYMAPEQLRGDALDERADVFALAALAFELLGGSPPFALPISQLEPVEEFRRHTPALPEIAVASAAAREALNDVLRRGLAYAPADRPESVDALVAGIVAAAGLGAGAAPMPAPEAPVRETPRRGTPGDRSARRLATVVHVQVEACGEERDEETLADRAAACLAAAEAALTDAGGLLVGRAPHEVIAVFGALSSTGDEPARAAGAARAVVAAGDGLPGVRVRAGIDTGRLLVRAAGLAGRTTVAGEVLSRAARLAAAAAPGEVRASLRTGRHLRRRFLLEPGPGGDDLCVAARQPAEARVGRETPLVGREEEVGALIDELAGSARTGEPRSALVLGATGIGKSRLRREVVEALSSRGDLRAAMATAEPHETLASYAALRALLGPLFPDADPLADPAMPPAAAARAALARAAKEHPLLLVLDDAHWSDDATLDLVEALARGEVEAPIAVLVLARPDLSERRQRLRRSFRLSLELGPLSPERARELAGLCLGEGAARESALLLAEAAEGNPFFVEELAQDQLERSSGVAATPSTVEEVIQARLDRLSDAEREVLRAAALLGHNFRRREILSLLAAVGAPETEELDACLAALDARRIVSPLPPDASADDRYALRHSLIREVAYREIAPAVRRRLHAAAAELLRGSSESVERLVALAGHLECSEDPEGALSAYRRAGDLATALGAAGDAFQCYARARALPGAAADVELSIQAGEAAVQAGAFAEAEAALDEAVTRAASRAERPELAARALHARASLAKQCGRWDEALGYTRRGLALVDEGRQPVLAARLHSLTGWVLGYIRGDNAAGLPESLRAVELLGPVGDKAELARAYSALGANYMRAGRWRDQLACNQRSLQLGEEMGSLEITARAHLNLGVNYLGLGELEESLSHSRHAVSQSERMCALALAAVARNNVALALVDLGRLGEAEEEVRRGLREAQRCGGCYFEDEALITLARVAAKRGDLSQARSQAEASLACARAQGGRVGEGIARRVLGAIRSLAGEHDAALAELDAAEEILRDADLGELARVRAERARALARRGDAEGAAREREGARGTFASLDAALELAKLEDLGWV
jgi:tetratricopeptide (TPR) repeat protein